MTGYQIYITVNRSRTLEEFNRFLMAEYGSARNIKNREMKAKIGGGYEAIFRKMREYKEIPENGLVVHYQEGKGVSIVVPEEKVQELECKVFKDDKKLY